MFYFLNADADVKFRIYSKPCYVYNFKNNIRYVLNCPNENDSITPCYFNMSLKKGTYILISKDNIDTLNIKVIRDSVLIKK